MNTQSPHSILTFLTERTFVLMMRTFSQKVREEKELRVAIYAFATECLLFLVLLFLADHEYNLEVLRLSSLDGRLDQEYENAKADAEIQNAADLNATTPEPEITQDPARRILKELLCK